MASINTIFKQVFGEGLKSRGFVKVKGRQPYFVRVVGKEILHVVAFKNEWCGDPGYKKFGIYGGVATVYRKSIDFSCAVRDNTNWLCGIRNFYIKSNPTDYDDYWQKLTSFPYLADDEECLRREMEHAWGETEKYMLPVLDRVLDLDACIEFFRIFHSFLLNVPAYDEDHGFGYGGGDEGLLYIQTDNHDDLVKKYQEMLDIAARAIENRKPGYGSYESEKKAFEEWRVDTVTERDEIYNTPGLYEKAMAELEQRKRANTEVLRSYGLEL